MPDIHQNPFFIRVLVSTGDPDGLRIVETEHRLMRNADWASTLAPRGNLFKRAKNEIDA